MIINLIDRLLDRMIQLKKAQETRRENLLKQHIRPLIDDFKTLHGQNLNSLQKTRDVLTSGASPDSVAAVIDELMAESRLTRSNRKSVYEGLLAWKAEDSILRLVRSVCLYLDTSDLPLNMEPEKEKLALLNKRHDIDVSESDIAGFISYDTHFRNNCKCTVATRLRLLSLEQGSKREETLRSEMIASVDRMTEYVQDRFGDVMESYSFASQQLSNT